MRILSCNPYHLLVVYVSKFGVGVLTKHEWCFHESRSRGLSCQTEIKKSSVVEVILRVPANTPIQFLLIR